MFVKIKNEIDLVLDNLIDIPLILFNKFTSVHLGGMRLKPSKYEQLCEDLNAYLLTKKRYNIKFINIDKVLFKSGVERSVDLRNYYYFNMLYTSNFLLEYVKYIIPIFISANGKMKKALIFDCDNTLWKGILGEDGFDKIEMSFHSKEGAIFAQVQLLAKNLARQGVIIGICSKNNVEDVLEVINKHPDMRLNNDDMAIKMINWDDKISNLKAIAQDLNIGLDSIIFVDDSDFEINLIRQYLPEVTVLQVPQDLCSYPSMINNISNLFYSISQTTEDSTKIKMYKEESYRKNEQNKFEHIEDYLSSLNLSVAIYIDYPKHISRISQLSQKTNQFNLTTYRYTELDINNFIASSQKRVFSFDVRDKFGDYGVTGACIILIDGNKAVIDTFLMSCRIIGRNVEFVFFDELIKYLNKIKIEYIEAQYIKTIKNGQVSDFYDHLGFNKISDTEVIKFYELDISEYSHCSVDYIEVTNG